jgi:hypothetical protein
MPGRFGTYFITFISVRSMYFKQEFIHKNTNSQVTADFQSDHIDEGSVSS